MRGASSAGRSPANRATVKREGERYVETSGRDVVLADVALAVQEGARAENNTVTRNVLATASDDALDCLVVFTHFKLLQWERSQNANMSAIFDDGQVWVVRHFRLHVLLVQVAVHLRARAVHLQLSPFAQTYSRSSRGIQHTKLDASQIRHSSYESVQSIDFANEMAFSDSSHRRLYPYRFALQPRTLQDISPIVRKFVVTSAVFTPARAATEAASSPA